MAAFEIAGRAKFDGGFVVSQKISLVPRGSGRIHNKAIIREVVAPKIGFDPYEVGKVSCSAGGDILLTSVTECLADQYRPSAKAENSVWHYLIQRSDRRLGKSHRVAVYRLTEGWRYAIKILIEKYGVDPNVCSVPLNTFMRYCRDHGDLVRMIDLGFEQAEDRSRKIPQQKMEKAELVVEAA